MKVKGIDGKIYTWSLGQYVGKENTNPSKLHLQVREFLRKNFPALQILEEVAIPGERLFLDFYIPVLKIAIEADGRQHAEDNRFFYKNKMEFMKARARDKRKIEWCVYNDIQWFRFWEGEDEEKWMSKMGLSRVD